MRYWLLKTEPQAFSWNDLQAKPDQTSSWDGVRNYQARNYMKEMKVNDLAFFYHSSVKPNLIVGIVKIVKEAHPDFSALDPKSDYFDPKASIENPRWCMVDVRAESEFEKPIDREYLKNLEGLEKMVLLQPGSRLSVMPVTAQEWKIICKISKIIKLK